MDLRPIGEERIRYALPAVMHLAKDFAGIDPHKKTISLCVGERERARASPSQSLYRRLDKRCFIDGMGKRELARVGDRMSTGKQVYPCHATQPIV